MRVELAFSRQGNEPLRHRPVGPRLRVDFIRNHARGRNVIRCIRKQSRLAQPRRKRGAILLELGWDEAKNAAAMIDAAEAYQRHLEKGGKMLVTLAGAMSTAELGLSLAGYYTQEPTA